MWISEWRPCRVIGADHKGIHCRTQRDDDTKVRSKLRELAQHRRRFDCYRPHRLVRRDRMFINRKKIPWR